MNSARPAASGSNRVNADSWHGGKFFTNVVNNSGPVLRRARCAMRCSASTVFPDPAGPTILAGPL
ncbi:hypothetical protein [Nocardia fluminea]|uniref:hypothetical protein n=1 Tax=Nocardia fluminea TaxID=134984 RepID=UPI000C6FD4FA|nr:hypothetical protein [Nocardia fluminea]